VIAHLGADDLVLLPRQPHHGVHLVAREFDGGVILAIDHQRQGPARVQVAGLHVQDLVEIGGQHLPHHRAVFGPQVEQWFVAHERARIAEECPTDGQFVGDAAPRRQILVDPGHVRIDEVQPVVGPVVVRRADTGHGQARPPQRVPEPQVVQQVDLAFEVADLDQVTPVPCFRDPLLGQVARVGIGVRLVHGQFEFRPERVVALGETALFGHVGHSLVAPDEALRDHVGQRNLVLAKGIDVPCVDHQAQLLSDEVGDAPAAVLFIGQGLLVVTQSLPLQLPVELEPVHVQFGGRAGLDRELEGPGERGLVVPLLERCRVVGQRHHQLGPGAFLGLWQGHVAVIVARLGRQVVTAEVVGDPVGGPEGVVAEGDAELELPLVGHPLAGPHGQPGDHVSHQRHVVPGPGRPVEVGEAAPRCVPTGAADAPVEPAPVGMGQHRGCRRQHVALDHGEAVGDLPVQDLPGLQQLSTIEVESAGAGGHRDHRRVVAPPQHVDTDPLGLSGVVQHRAGTLAEGAVQVELHGQGCLSTSTPVEPQRGGIDTIGEAVLVHVRESLVPAPVTVVVPVVAHLRCAGVDRGIVVVAVVPTHPVRRDAVPVHVDQVGSIAVLIDPVVGHLGCGGMDVGIAVVAVVVHAVAVPVHVQLTADVVHGGVTRALAHARQDGEHRERRLPGQHGAPSMNQGSWRTTGPDAVLLRQVACRSSRCPTDRRAASPGSTAGFDRSRPSRTR